MTCQANGVEDSVLDVYTWIVRIFLAESDPRALFLFQVGRFFGKFVL